MLRLPGVRGLLVFLAAYAVIYWSHLTGSQMGVDARISFFLGSLAALCMALAFVIAARPKIAEGAFGGLDKMYRVHKYLGVSALILFLVHFATVPDGDSAVEAGAALREEETHLPIGPFGIFSAIGFIVLIILTLNRKFAYHRWFKTHQFMGLFYTLVTVHILLFLYEGKGFSFASLPGLFLATSLTFGLGAFFYKLLVFPRRQRHHFVVEAVNKLERATEVVLAPVNNLFSFQPGQFAFLTIDAPGFKEAHPFTISSAPDEGQLRFTMKVLGDYTRRVRDELEAGHSVEVEGPYGCFDFEKGPDKQVWIAGGVGITPFLSALRHLQPGHGKTIHVYYCVREQKEALFLGELHDIAKRVGGVTLGCLQSNAGEFITVDRLSEELSGSLSDWHYYLCGPKPMIDAMKKGLRAEGVSAGQLHNEEFDMR